MGRNEWAEKGRAGPGQAGPYHSLGLTFLEQLFLAAVQGANLPGQVLWLLRRQEAQSHLLASSHAPQDVYLDLVCTQQASVPTARTLHLCQAQSSFRGFALAAVSA